MTPDAEIPRTAPPDADATLPPTVTGDAAAAIRDLNTDATLSPRAGPAPAVDAPPGFVIERELGVGGMGVVYLARQVGLNRPVALKLVKDGRVDSKALIRFLAEAEAVAAVRHPNVVEVFQYGEHAGKPYMALAFCPGGDLTALVGREPTASVLKDDAWFRRVADLMAKVADGVNAAHAQGIIHRDLKPHNVLLTADGTPKVADFGLAKRGLGSDLTHTQDVLGTPAYMAPEQAGQGTKFVGPEADVWALGVMLFELCCGERPIDTSGPLLDTLVRVATAQVPPLRTKAPTVPTDLALIAHKCLSKDPRDRYPTAGGLAADLRNWLDGKPISARPAGVIEQAVKWAKRNKKLASMGLAVLLTMTLATGVSLGFGFEANKQADIAKGEKKNAENAAHREKAEKENVQRTLAKALLGPIAPFNPRDTEAPPLSTYELDAVWELVRLRGGPVGLMLMDEATRTPMASAQLRNRGVLLDHAVVGLDSAKRRDADEYLAACLRDTQHPSELRRDLALAAVDAERFPDPDALAAALLTAIEGATTPRQSSAPPSGKIRARVSSVYPYRWGEMAVALTAVCDRLPADLAAELLESAVSLMCSALVKPGWFSGREELATPLSVLCNRLPGEQVGVRQAVVEQLVGMLGARAFAHDHCLVAEAVAGIAGRLPPDRAAEVCQPAVDHLLAALGKASTSFDRHHLTQGLAAVMGQLPADKATEVGRKVTDGFLADHAKATDANERWTLANGLAVVASQLPAEDAVEILLEALAAKPGQSDDRNVLLVRLAARCSRLAAADRAAEVLSPNYTLTWTAPHSGRWLKDWRPCVRGCPQR